MQLSIPLFALRKGLSQANDDFLAVQIFNILQIERV